MLARSLCWMALAVAAGGLLMTFGAGRSSAQTAAELYWRRHNWEAQHIRRASHQEMQPLPEAVELLVPAEETAPQLPVETFDPSEMIAMSIDDGEMPEDADLTSAIGVPFTPPSATPYSIGDGLGYGGGYVIEDGFGDVLRFAPAGGRKFKAANHNSPVPRTRVYYNYAYLNDAFSAHDGFSNRSIDLTRHELGVEYAVCCNMASIELQVPWNNAINTNLDVSGGLGTLQDMQIGNVAVALKVVVYQQGHTTVSGGAGVDLPTADDFTVTDGNAVFALENDSVTVSPYIAALYADPCGSIFAQGFAQFSMPLNENTVYFYDGADTAVDDVEEATLLHLDASIGYWLHRDCCGNGFAGIFELHYTMDLNGRAIVDDNDDPIFAAASLVRRDVDLFHATAGVTYLHGCWDVTPALVAPLLNNPSRLFDWQATLQVNRRF